MQGRHSKYLTISTVWALVNWNPRLTNLHGCGYKQPISQSWPRDYILTNGMSDSSLLSHSPKMKLLAFHSPTPSCFSSAGIQACSWPSFVWKGDGKATSWKGPRSLNGHMEQCGLLISWTAHLWIVKWERSKLLLCVGHWIFGSFCYRSSVYTVIGVFHRI